MQETPSERERIAEERDRTADERDRLADKRDRTADERDRLADKREHEADERDRNGARPTTSESDDSPVAADDDIFGIDLGPSRERTEAVDDDPASMTAPVRPRTRSLTDRLASAAADRDDAGTPKEGGRSPED